MGQGGAGPADNPIDETLFSGLMAGLGPFEPSPAVAVGVSGGADSMALCLLADRWARAWGGRVLALTVDHGLRPQSADEAKAVARWLGARGIAHRILTWTPGHLRASLQAAAREARYALLQRACVEARVLHLLMAHTLDDQAETVLLRLAKGSGVDGLAAMPSVRETSDVHILRPLLGIAKRSAQATCRSLGQDWIDDPSNRADRFARGRLRRVSDLLRREGLSPARLAGTARRAGRARAALDSAAAGLLAEVAAPYPEGYAVVDGQALARAPEELALRALSQCLVTIGGAMYPPRLERLERLYRALRDGGIAGGRTLTGCRVLPISKGSTRLVVCREPSAAGTLDLAEAGAGLPDRIVHWDGRFRITLPAGAMPPRLAIRRLGIHGRSALRSAGLLPDRLPPAAALSLPGLWAGDRLFALPQFAPLQRPPESCTLSVCGVEFVPRRRLSDPAFAVV